MEGDRKLFDSRPLASLWNVTHLARIHSFAKIDQDVILRDSGSVLCKDKWIKTEVAVPIPIFSPLTGN